MVANIYIQRTPHFHQAHHKLTSPNGPPQIKICPPTLYVHLCHTSNAVLVCVGEYLHRTTLIAPNRQKIKCKLSVLLLAGHLFQTSCDGVKAGLQTLDTAHGSVSFLLADELEVEEGFSGLDIGDECLDIEWRLG